jgi:hypothetical protein
MGAVGSPLLLLLLLLLWLEAVVLVVVEASCWCCTTGMTGMGGAIAGAASVVGRVCQACGG